MTYKSGNIATQIDFILFHRTMRKLVTDVKVIPGEEVALQHQLLVCDMRIDVSPKSKRKFTPRIKVWKLKDPQTSNHFQEVFNLHVSTSAGVADEATEDIWNNIKTGLLKTTEEVCGTTRPHRWRRETWWWNEHVEKAIAAKRTAFKAWKAGKGTRASYDAAKRNARHAVHHAHQEADKKVYENIDPKSSEVYRLANKFRRENTDVVGDKPVKNDAGEMSMSEDSKQKAWLEHYQRLLNVEFDWDPDHLSYQPPVEGPPIPITTDMVKKAISQMKAGKAPGPSGIVVEMPPWSVTSQLQSFVMARYPLTESRVSLSASTREKGTHWKEATTAVSSWQSRLWKSWRGLWRASSDSWWQSTIPSLALSQAEALQTQSLLLGSCKRSI